MNQVKVSKVEVYTTPVKEFGNSVVYSVFYSKNGKRMRLIKQITDKDVFTLVFEATTKYANKHVKINTKTSESFLSLNKTVRNSLILLSAIQCK